MIPANFKPTLHELDEADSTNRVARELAEGGAAEGTVVLARRQTRGRGRNSRAWHSPEGGLYLSVLLYPREIKRVTDLSIVAGVAVAQAVKECLPKASDISVKWPNDCLVGWKKVAGVLCEALGEEHYYLCVVGIGININVSASELAPFQDTPFPATSFSIETGGETEVSRVKDMVLTKLFSVYRLYHEQGFAAVQYLWERNCGFIGKKVELRESGWRDNPEAAKEHGVTVGTFLGIDDSGALVLSNAQGERRPYVTGEITCFWP